MADINKLKDKIKSTIYPNGKGAINASDHQAMLLDMADGMAETDTKLATLSEEIRPIAENITETSDNVTEESIEIEDNEGNILVKITPTEIDIKKMRLVGENIGSNSSPLMGKKIYYCGDSVIKGAASVPEAEKLPLRIDSAEGSSSTSYAENGSLFVYPHPSSAGRSILQQLMQVPSDADYIIVEGGVNGVDYTANPMGTMTESYNSEFDTTTQVGCLEAICKYLSQNFAGKKVGFIVCYQIKEGYGQYVSYWKPKAETFIEVLKKWGIPYIDWRESGVNLSANAANYGIDTWDDYEEFDASKSYEIDDRVIYEGNAYKANTAISAGAWNASQWTKISSGRYDTWHPNSAGYAILASKTAAWLKSL